MEKSLNEALYGKEISQKMDAVTAALEKVNEKHKDYFSSMKSKMSEDELSSLTEFTLIQWNNTGASIGILPGLREDIAEEARQAFLDATSNK